MEKKRNTPQKCRRKPVLCWSSQTDVDCAAPGREQTIVHVSCKVPDCLEMELQ